MGVIRDIQSGVMNILPEAEHEISEINGLLSGILVDAGQMGGHNINFENSNAESRQIMDEASAIAEEKMKEQFPDLPSAADSLLPKKNKIEGLFE
jgi:division protein CdvB (Snf7/Vps24/ESCRT-III family)